MKKIIKKAAAVYVWIAVKLNSQWAAAKFRVMVQQVSAVVYVLADRQRLTEKSKLREIPKPTAPKQTIYVFAPIILSP